MLKSGLSQEMSQATHFFFAPEGGSPRAMASSRGSKQIWTSSLCMGPFPLKFSLTNHQFGNRLGMSIPDVFRPRLAPQQIKPFYVVVDPMILRNKLKDAVFSPFSPNGQNAIMGELPKTL
jgi:hypothetical protein